MTNIMIRKAFFPILLFVAFATSVFGQQRPAAPPGAKPTPTPAATAPTTTSTPAQTNVALPMSKMAIIYTDAFLDPKTGIAKFNNAVNKLNDEFKKIKDDITAMQNRAQALETEINKLRDAPAGTPIDQTALQNKMDQLDQLKKDIQRKLEDAQTAYNKRRNDLLGPLQLEIGTALEAFAKARGINVIIDGAQVPLLYAAESTDITRAFINEFNAKYPVAAVTSTPPQ